MADGRDDPTTLLASASSDIAAIRALLGNAEITNAIVGFHAQQAVEKSIKAALALHESDYPFTHDIERLIRLLRTRDVAIDFPAEDAADLTGWAAKYRYGEPDEELDRRAVLNLAETVHAWAQGFEQ